MMKNGEPDRLELGIEKEFNIEFPSRIYDRKSSSISSSFRCQASLEKEQQQHRISQEAQQLAGDGLVMSQQPC